MKVEGEGRTVPEAEADALSKLEAAAGPFDRGEVELTVVSEGSKGFLGMGSTLARVEARLGGGAAEERAAAPAEESAPVSAVEAEGRLKEYLNRMVAGFGLEASVSVSDRGDVLYGSVNGGDLGIFIGRHGQTIDAVQYLANIIVYRGLEGRKRVVVDAEDYRDRRTEMLQALADQAAGEVLDGRPRYEMKPMNSAERRIVHVFLQDREGVETVSEGDEPFRRVVVTRSGNTGR